MILRATRPIRSAKPTARIGKAGIAAWAAVSLAAHALAVATLVAWDRTPAPPPAPYLPVEIVVEQPRVAKAIAETKRSIPRSAAPSPHAPQKSVAKPDQQVVQRSVIPAERRSRVEPEARATDQAVDIEKAPHPKCNEPPCAGPGSRITALRAASGMTGKAVPKSEASQTDRTKAVSITEPLSASSDRALPAAMPPVPRSRPETPPVFVAIPKQTAEMSGADGPQSPVARPAASVDNPAAPPPDKPAGVLATDPGPKKRAIPALEGATAGVSRPPVVDGGADNAPPVYPYLARERGWEGRVVLRVAVDAAGGVQAISVETGSGQAILDRAAADAVRTWRFRPASSAGQAVAGMVKVPISFRLRKN